MKKLLLMAVLVAVACAPLMVDAQDDIAAIVARKAEMTDSMSLLYGKMCGMKAAMDYPKKKQRQDVLKGLTEGLQVESKDEYFKEGNSVAGGFFKVAEDMKNRLGIDMSRKLYYESFMISFSDTAVVDLNNVLGGINVEARRLIEELTALHNDSTVNKAKSKIIASKTDSLSRNMGRFYGVQVRSMCKNRNFTADQERELMEGFNYGINMKEKKQAVLSGRMVADDFIYTRESIKRHIDVVLNKDVFFNAFCLALNDQAVPTQEQCSAAEAQFTAYAGAVETYARENSPEALTHRNMGKVYVENLLERDPEYVQTPSGLVYKVLAPGEGANFSENDRISVMYKGTHVDGSTFDQSESPVTFSPNQVVPGFREALLLMRPGAKMIAVIPYNLGYGERGAGDVIKPYETLVFEIETLGLEEVTPPAPVAPAAQP